MTFTPVVRDPRGDRSFPVERSPQTYREQKTMIGLPAGTVRIEPYVDDWPRLYREERARIAVAIGAVVVDIQHIGSASIPSLPAKPIIDIGIAVQNFEAAHICIRPMLELGYDYKGEFGIPRRHYFVKGEPRTHHVHMVEVESEDWRSTVTFRNYLKERPQVAKAYADLKMALAQQFPTDREAYTDGKSTFVKEVLGLANKR